MSGPIWEFDAAQFENVVKVSGPADSDCHAGDAIFQNQVPAGQPCQKFSQGRIRIGIGASGDRNHRGKLRITEGSKGAGDSRENEGQHDSRPRSWPVGIPDDSGADQHEDAGADNRSDAKPGQVPGCQSPFQAMFRGVRISEDLFDGFGAKQRIAHAVSSLRSQSRPCPLSWLHEHRVMIFSQV